MGPVYLGNTMKTTPRLSGPVLAFGIVCLAIISATVWYGLKRPRASSDTTPAPTTEAVAATEPEGTPQPDTSTPQPTRRVFDGIPPVIPVSLAGSLTEAENSLWLKDKLWLTMPRDTQSLAGVEFHIDGLIQLQSDSSSRGKQDYRRRVVVSVTETNLSGDPTLVAELRSNIGCLHLLGANRYSSDTISGTRIADVIWHYEDGETRRTPLEYNVHVREWRRTRYEEPERLPYAGSKVVWRGENRTDADRSLRLYRVTLPNPVPTKVIQSLEFVSTMAAPSLVFVALSLDPLNLGERPDDSPDLEETDPPPAGQIAVFVLTPQGNPLPSARVRALFTQKAGGKTSRINKSLTTDANGMAHFRFTDVMPEQLDLSAWQDDANYGGRKMLWDTTAGDIIPPTYTFTLGEGIGIGGTVVDESDQPIAEAKLSFYRYWTGGEEMNKRGEQADFSGRTATTDAQGNWQTKGLPPEMLDRIGFEVKHPDFINTSLQIGNDDTGAAQLRAGTHRIVMKRGLIVRGKVMDESDNPVKDAQVWAGKLYYSGTQEAKTDAKGEFSFRNLKEGDVPFSVLAKGLKPETKTIAVKPGTAEIIFKLGKGNLIRGVVRNETGEAISDARLSLESRMNDGSQAFRFEMKSDKDGRFEWDGAPEEPQRFYIYKEGYESKSGQTLKVAEENVVTLRKGRKVQGWVVDAETEKPITKFRVGVGRKYNVNPEGDRISINSPGMKEYANPNGTFTLEVSEEQINGIKGVADDYAEKLEDLPAAEDGVVKVILRLKPSPALRGILVDSQGAPVAGGTVALTKDNMMGGGSILLRNGRLSTYDQGNKVVTTDASGNFTLSSPPESGGVVVGSAAVGFGSASVDQVRSSGRLVLQGFGRIEGTIKVAGVPTAGQQFSFSIANIGVSYQSDGFAKSDEQGKFTFEKLPAGEGSVVRLIKMTENSWRHSHSTSVIIEPGKTTPVSFGEEGAVIKGQVRLEVPPADGETLTFNASLDTKRPEIPQNLATPEEAQAYYKSTEWKEQMKQMKYYGATITADGALSLDSIPPGEYTLSVSANKPGNQPWQQQAVASASITITVPASASPYAPIAISDIILKPVKK